MWVLQVEFEVCVKVSRFFVLLFPYFFLRDAQRLDWPARYLMDRLARGETFGWWCVDLIRLVFSWVAVGPQQFIREKAQNREFSMEA